MSDKLPVFDPKPYDQWVYRNIATCDPRQALYDDLTDEGDKLERLVQASSGIDHARLLEMHRPFQYGNLDDDLLRVFKRENWRLGRFGDGLSYGVWYSAEAERTSIQEAGYWAYRLALDNVLPRGEVYSADRTMYRARLQSERSLDLTIWRSCFENLIHPRNYNFCHKVGQAARVAGIELLRSPSARDVAGICTPVLEAMAIKEASACDLLRFHVRPDGGIAVNSSAGICMALQGVEFENPHRIS